MNSISPSDEKTAESFDNHQIKSGDKVYQLGWFNDKPKLIELTIIEVQNINRIRVYNPVDSAISNFISSKTVHTNGLKLIQRWIDDLNNIANQIPRNLEDLNNVKTNIDDHIIRSPEINKVAEVEI
jgi:hypothetical protein